MSLLDEARVWFDDTGGSYYQMADYFGISEYEARKLMETLLEEEEDEAEGDYL
tara:strand:+ start:2264 stop:2422 length:159 start_codon:yes stop_codon:yes gene_type:complete